MKVSPDPELAAMSQEALDPWIGSLRGEAEKLLRLINEPEHGLLTWHLSFLECVASLHHLTGPSSAKDGVS